MDAKPYHFRPDTDNLIVIGAGARQVDAQMIGKAAGLPLRGRFCACLIKDKLLPAVLRRPYKLLL